MLKRVFLATLVVIGFLPVAEATDNLDLAAFDRLDGFIDLYWVADTGRILIDVEEIDHLLGDPAQIEILIPVTVPPGSPIGSYQTSIH